jgi:hypothetical protein
MNTAASHAQRLEGSRFVGGSSMGWQQAAPESDPGFAIVADVGARKGGTIRARRWIDVNTLGSFREPPAAKPQSCHLGKRLPSRPWATAPSPFRPNSISSFVICYWAGLVSPYPISYG